MLYREIKIVVVCVFLILCSCKKELTQEEELLLEHKEEIERDKMRIQYYTFSKNLVREKEYNAVVKNANDSLENWIANGLPTYKYIADSEHKIDTLFCFNSKKNKCISCIISKGYKDRDHTDKDYRDVQGSLDYLYGVKIKKKWFFFNGPTVIIPRNYFYTKNIQKPFTFDQLHNIAIRQIHNGYLKQRENSKVYEINEDFFSDITSGAYCTDCKTQQEYDTFFLNYIRTNWITKYKPLKEGEIVYEYDKTKKTMKVTFPMHYPTFPDVGIISIQLDYWKTLPSDKETMLLRKENGWESYYPQYDRSESVQSGEIKNKNIKNYSKLLVSIEPNTSYTMRIEFCYDIGSGGHNPIYVTHFTAK
jgi:hypothetical protein